MNTDVRVVMAFAAAVLLLPAVVNGIMVKAAKQVDTEWLRDLDGSLDPEDSLRPNDIDPDDIPPGYQPPPGLEPPPGQQPPPPFGCTPVADPTASDSAELRGSDLINSGVLAISLREGDIAVVAKAEVFRYNGVSEFVVEADGLEKARYGPEGFPVLNGTDLRPFGRDGYIDIRPAEIEWRLPYDLTRATFDRASLSLVAIRCAEAGP